MIYLFQKFSYRITEFDHEQSSTTRVTIDLTFEPIKTSTAIFRNRSTRPQLKKHRILTLLVNDYYEQISDRYRNIHPQRARCTRDSRSEVDFAMQFAGSRWDFTIGRSFVRRSNNERACAESIRSREIHRRNKPGGLHYVHCCRG